MVPTGWGAGRGARQPASSRGRARWRRLLPLPLLRLQLAPLLLRVLRRQQPQLLLLRAAHGQPGAQVPCPLRHLPRVAEGSASLRPPARVTPRGVHCATAANACLTTARPPSVAARGALCPHDGADGQAHNLYRDPKPRDQHPSGDGGVAGARLHWRARSSLSRACAPSPAPSPGTAWHVDVSVAGNFPGRNFPRCAGGVASPPATRGECGRQGAAVVIRYARVLLARSGHSGLQLGEYRRWQESISSEGPSATPPQPSVQRCAARGLPPPPRPRNHEPDRGRARARVARGPVLAPAPRVVLRKIPAIGPIARAMNKLNCTTCSCREPHVVQCSSAC